MTASQLNASAAADFLSYAENWPVLATVAAVGLAAALVAAWVARGSSPRRSRRYKKIQKFLQQGNWQVALDLVRQIGSGRRLSPLWVGRLQTAEGDCHRLAGAQAVQAKDFEGGLEHHLRAATLLGTNPSQVRTSVREKMLAEVRALFAATTGPDTAAVQAMIGRLQKLQGPGPESLFWQGLCHIREGKWELAQHALEGAVRASTERPSIQTPNGGNSSSPTLIGPTVVALSPGFGITEPAHRFVDPPLYLGGLMLRLGQPKEALRLISEAQRDAPNCPWVSLHLGIAMLAAGADSHFATRALTRALAPMGLPAWLKEPDKAWIDGLPENGSFVRKLAASHRFVCPLWSSDLRLLIRQGQMALGQAYYRSADYQAAAECFQQILNESAPTRDVLRWLGLTLTRQEHYQEAFKHLKTALELEDPKDRLTAGCLALCAARGKPERPEDKGPNVEWAIRTVRQFEAFGDREWAGVVQQIFDEAMAVNLALSSEDLVFLCDHLLSVQAVDPQAALAYHNLASQFPDLVKPPHAWLYCRAAMLHDCRHPHSLELFARTFDPSSDARTYFTNRGWDFAELEYAYLRLAAFTAPGEFPRALGEEYIQRGQALLLNRSLRLAKDNKAEAALESAEVLARLAPRNPQALDRLAMLCHRGGLHDRAMEVLREWCRLEATNPLPWARLAVLQHQNDKHDDSMESMREATGRASGRTRADLSCLAGRMVLASVWGPADAEVESGSRPLGQSLVFLEDCLRVEPDHQDALWLSAAVRSVLQDRTALAALSSTFEAHSSGDPRFQFFGAVSHLAKGNHGAALEAAVNAAADPALKVEASYLAGWANYYCSELETSASAFEVVAQAPQSPSRSHAHAMLGTIRCRQGKADAAIESWQALDAPTREAWQLNRALQQSLFLAGLQGVQKGHFVHAANRFREAGKAGWRDRSLADLVRFALVKGGQSLAGLPSDNTQHFMKDRPRARQEPESLSAKHNAANLEAAGALFEQALQIGTSDSNVAYMLALVRKRQGKIAEAQAVLHKIAQPDANAVLQMGLLAFNGGYFLQAEQEFARAWELDGTLFAAGYNLMLSRLCQGKIGACVPLVAQLKAVAARTDDQRILTLLEPLLDGCQTLPNGTTLAIAGTDEAKFKSALAAMSAEDEQRLLETLLGLGQMDSVLPLLQGLAMARPSSQIAQQAAAAGLLLQAKGQADRCHWAAAEKSLSQFVKALSNSDSSQGRIPQEYQSATYNLLGCCQCMLQDFDRGIDSFSWALKLSPNDPWLHQNLALAWELKGQLDQADNHWNRYLDLQNRVPVPVVANYRDALAFEGLNRLADAFSKKERWNTALTYLQRACRIRPGDFDALERLFHMYNQVKRPEDARRTLLRLRELRPTDPQLELYELDLLEVKTIEDIERMLARIRKAVNQHPSDGRVEDKAVSLVGNVIPILGKMCDQYSGQLSRIADQMRRLPNYQINWSAVHEVMRDLDREFRKLRRLVHKCLALVISEEQRRAVRELMEHIDQKIEVCQQMGA